MAAVSVKRSIHEGHVALRGTYSRYVIGCCIIPLGICGLKNNSRRITYGIGRVWGMPSLSPLSSLGSTYIFQSTRWHISKNTLFMHRFSPTPPPPPPPTPNLPFSFCISFVLISPEYLLYQEKWKVYCGRCTGYWMHSKRCITTKEYANWGYQTARRWRGGSSDNSAKRR